MVEEARVEKRKGRKQKKCTSDSGSSSKMRWVTDISSFCLDCKKERGTKDKVIYIYIYRGSARLAARKSKSILDVTYSSLSSRMRSCLSFTASCFASKGSICRWSRSSRLGLTSRLKLGRTFLTRCRNVCHFNLLLPIWRIFTSVPIPPFFLFVPFEDGRWVLFLGIR